MRFMGWFFKWMMSQVAWTIIRLEIHHLWNPDWTYAFPAPQEQNVVMDDEEASVEDMYFADDDDPGRNMDTMYVDTLQEDELMSQFSLKDGSPIPLLQMTYINKTKPQPCDKHIPLYELREERLYKRGRPEPVKGKLSNCHENECERPFSVQMIQHTNMILIVADRLCPCFQTKISIEPQKIEYGFKNETAYCDKLKYNIYRKRPDICIPYHAEETEIKLCGDASSFHLSKTLWLFCVLMAFLLSRGGRHSTSGL